jgi:hypothetical protein
MSKILFSPASAHGEGYNAGFFARKNVALAAFVFSSGLALGICLIVIWTVVEARRTTRIAVKSIAEEAVVENEGMSPKYPRVRPSDTVRRSVASSSDRVPRVLGAPRIWTPKGPRLAARALMSPTDRAISPVTAVFEPSFVPVPRPAPRDTGPSERVAPSDGIQLARADPAPEGLASLRLTEPEAAPLQIPHMAFAGCSPLLAREIPRRPAGARGGSAVMARVGNGSGSARDNAIVAEAENGNIPDFMRDLQPVRFSGLVGGRRAEITICVTPDYLAIGSDADHVRVPLGMPAALRVAESFGMMLPTTRMVDAIYAQAGLRLSPRPMPAGPQMRSTDYFMRHDATVDAQFARAGGHDGVLVAGHKKDVVLANRLSRAPGRVAIYGWHRGKGDPIQPLSTVHGAFYADYSHGIRLVSRTAYLNGRATDLTSLLTDSRYAGILNDDGPINAATVRLASL